MEARTFNSVMGRVNEEWTAKVLGMKTNPSFGPDLIGDDKVVEVKFNLVNPSKYSHRSWRVLEHEMNYANNRVEGYWALGFYSLDRLISKIQSKNKVQLEKRVLSREMYIVVWDWMNQFNSYHHQGKTDISEWDHYIRFPKFSKLPKVIESKEVTKGAIHFTEGVNSKRFNVNGLETAPF